MIKLFSELKPGESFRWGAIDALYKKVDGETAIRQYHKYWNRLYAFGPSCKVEVVQ